MIRFDVAAETITEDDATIRSAAEVAAPKVLLATVAQVTGDFSLLIEMEADPLRAAEPGGGYTAAQIAEAASLATAALAAYRDAGCPKPAPLTDAQTRGLIDYLAGQPMEDRYYPMIREELALGGEDLRAPAWHVADGGTDRTFTVGIIGAGMSGIVAAHRLSQAGVTVRIFEKSADVGGTWHDNRYPGCRVDVPSAFYSYSFAQTIDWPEFFSQRSVLDDYFNQCVDTFGLRDFLELSTEVTKASWDETANQWQLDLHRGDGTTESCRVDALVSAMGQLNRPVLPTIAGRDDFAGPSFHSARWDRSIDLSGKRVGVIGTGASAVQFLPRIVDQAAHVTVFQRRPPWILQVPIYQQSVPEGLRWIKRHLPSYQSWERAAGLVGQDNRLLPFTAVDPAWDRPDSMSEMNELLRLLLLGYFEENFESDEMREAVTPTYPPAAKRALLDDGLYARTLQRDDLTLVTAGIDHIEPTGIETSDGTVHELDVLIMATGFAASGFLMPLDVTGRNKVSLHDQWAGDARAYLGITVPNMPNLFLMYGPNTNIVINGSIIFFSECETNYIVDSVRQLVQEGPTSMTVRADVHDAYNDDIDAGNLGRVWGASDVSSWYKNEFGRSATNWPHTLIRFWEQTRELNPTDYEWDV